MKDKNPKSTAMKKPRQGKSGKTQTAPHLIDIVTVSYNAPDLIEGLLASIREFYPNRVIVIDGSDSQHVEQISNICSKYDKIEFIHFNYNIHHGPGLAWAYSNIDLSSQVLVLDSDVVLINPGMIESLCSELGEKMYGVGYINYVNRDGFNIQEEPDAVRYLQPACMLCNIETVRKWPMPIKHGAPNIAPMLAIHDARQHDLIRNVQWVEEDCNSSFEPKHHIRHDWQGTVLRVGSYNLDEWMNEVRETQEERAKKASVLGAQRAGYNPDLLHIIPKDASLIIEVGCGDGSLAAAYRQKNSKARYIGIEIDQDKIKAARSECDEVINSNIETLDDRFFDKYKNADVWVFGDVLERLCDPWSVLRKIRNTIPDNGSIVVSIPNVQHWSIQLKLAIGDFRYDPAGGLLDKTHLRFFTRTTMLEMFALAGFKMEIGFPRILDQLTNPLIIEAIRSMATAAGVSPDDAVRDSMAFQYIVKFVPECD